MNACRGPCDTDFIPRPRVISKNGNKEHASIGDNNVYQKMPKNLNI